MLSCLLPDSDVTVFDEVTLDEKNGQIVCVAGIREAKASCPICGHATVRVHSSYHRKLADLPWAGMPVQIRLQARRFFCKNGDCRRKVFCERIPTVAAPWARRTQRLANAQQAIGLVAGGSGGVRLCVALAMHAGIDLLLALVRNVQLPERPPPRVLGVDDWAKRKGQTYGTILVDLEQGEVVDILADRTAESLEAWLKAHPGVEIVSRDRAGAYAQGARQGAPDAIQIADRWHLLKNLTDAIYKVLQKHRSAIERELAQRQGASGVENRAARQELSHAYADLGHPTAADLARQKRQQDAYRLHEQGWTNRAIGMHIGVCPKTISRYLKTGVPSSPLRRSRRRQLIDPYRAYLIERWNAGCHNAAQLCREIQAQGFAGQYTIVRHFVSALRRISEGPRSIGAMAGVTVNQDPIQRPPTIRMLAHFIGRPSDKLDEHERKYIELLDNIHPRLTEAVRLAREFSTMIRQRQVDKLNLWLAKAKTSLLKHFAIGLCQDYRAVRAALSLPWSNGPTEGHINRLKCLRRQMYGRAKLDLLRQRLLAA